MLTSTLRIVCSRRALVMLAVLDAACFLREATLRDVLREASARPAPLLLCHLLPALHGGSSGGSLQVGLPLEDHRTSPNLACVVAAAMTHPRHHGPHALAAPSSRKTFFMQATSTYCCAGAVCGMRPAVHARPSSLAPTFADAENPETFAEAHLLSCDATKMSRCVHASLLCSDLF